MKRLHIFCKELLRRCTGNVNIVYITQQALDKSRAVDPFFISAAIFVRRFHPFINERVQYDVRKTIRRCFQIGSILGDQLFFSAGIGQGQRSIGRLYDNGLVRVC